MDLPFNLMINNLFFKLFFGIFISIILVVLPHHAEGQKKETKPNEQSTRILFILDASRSMLGRWESDLKINIATKLLAEMVDSLAQLGHIQMALRVYGHQTNVEFFQDCEDSRLEVPFSFGNSNQIKQKIKRIKCQGTTPIAYTLEKCQHDFPPNDEYRNIVILITDGIEACDGDPCAVSLALQKKGVVLKPFVIGVGLDLGFRETFDCVGRYYDASDERRFKEVFNVVISQALNSTSAQVNLLDIHGMPTETNVNMTFYDNNTGNWKYNIVHTINHKGVPDTIYLDPLINYRLVVHTIPSVSIDSVALIPGTHTIIALDAPQGELTVISEAIQQRDLMFEIYESGTCNQLNIQKLNTKEKYLIGEYDLVIRTIPEIRLSSVSIEQHSLSKIEIPRPGIATFLMNTNGFGSIYLEDGNELVWLRNLANDKSRESLLLQPGNYRAVFRTKNSHQSNFTISKAFRVNSGGSVQVQLY